MTFKQGNVTDIFQTITVDSIGINWKWYIVGGRKIRGRLTQQEYFIVERSLSGTPQSGNFGYLKPKDLRMW